MRNLRDLFAVISVALATLVVGLTAILGSFVDRSGKIADACHRVFAKIVEWISGMVLQVEGIEHVDANRSYVFVVNHQSHMDAIALVLSCPVPLRMLAKKSLYYFPIFGQALSRVGHIRVSRTKGKTDMAKVRAQTKGLIQARRSLCIFAEGRRQNVVLLSPFKYGAFKIAKENDLPLLPVAIVGTGRILPAKSLHFTPGQARIRYHPPIEPGLGDVSELRQLTFEILKKSLREMESAI